MINSIGIVGRGFLGRTLEYVFLKLAKKRSLDLKIYDIKEELATHTLKEVAQCEVVFVGVPTPTVIETGECYTGFVEDAIKNLRELNKENLVIVKSTVPPGTCKKWNEQHKNIIFNPEFLTEKSPELDFCELDYQILGVDGDLRPDIYKEYFSKIRELNDLFKELGERGITRCKVVHVVDHTTAEMIKYTRNCYLATRLSFFNEIAQVCKKLNINYNQMKKLAGLDERIGDHYNIVKPGWGGSCLYKDINAMIFFEKQLNIDPKVLKGVLEKNLEVCVDKDWETMIGRAILSQKK